MCSTIGRTADLARRRATRQKRTPVLYESRHLSPTAAHPTPVTSGARRLLKSRRARLLSTLALPIFLALALALGMGGTSVGGAFEKMLSASPLALVLVLALSLVQAASGAIRLWFVFPRAKRPGLVRVARAFSFGQLVNTYVPGRAGDVFKVLSIARDHDRRRGDHGRRDHGDHANAPAHGSASVAETTGAVLADRGLDVASLVLLAAVFGGGALVTFVVRMAEHLWLAALAAGVIAAMLAVCWRVWPGGFRRLGRAVSSVLVATRAALSAHRLPAIVAMALAGWIAELVAMTLLAAELGFHLSFPHAVVAMFVLNLGIALPVTVANVGAFEAAAAAGLAAFGIPMADGIAIGTVLHAGQVAAVIIAAVAFWLRDCWLRRARAVCDAALPIACEGAGPEERDRAVGS